MNHDIVVAAEQRDGIVQKISFELIHGAAEVAGQTGGRVITVIAGFEIKEAAEQLSAAGSDEVWIIDQPSLKEYLPKPYTEAFLQAVKHIEPEIVLIGSTMIGMELAPQLAAGLDTGLVTDCTALTISSDTGLLLMTRPNTDGISIDTFICGERRPQIATVRPGVLAETGARDKADSRKSAEKVSQPAAGPRGTVRHFTADLSGADNGVRLLSTTRGGVKSTDITQARVLVAGGRGMGGPEGFDTLRTLASLLGGQIACSRACVEAGWIDASPQVGQTGKTVRPELYLACGISGAFQHVTGMEESQLIIAINKNPAAPIFDISDLGIVGNVEVLLPRLIAALK